MIRAVLFDFGGTLYDYATLAQAERESLVALARWAGVDADPVAVLRAHRAAMRGVFQRYLPRPFYRHRDLFRDALVAMLEALGAAPEVAHLERYRALQWEGHLHHFALREGVVETLAALRARGLHVGLVSNVDEDQLAHLLAVARLEGAFDAVLSSERAGSCKPDGAIFAAALGQAGCRPAEALFVGDSIPQDVAGANRAGLRSVLLWHRTDREPPATPPRPDHVVRSIPEVLAVLAEG